MDERPTATLNEDLLERGEFIRRLGKALVKDDDSRATGVVVGITGEWGSGKSSILKMAAHHLENDRGAIVIPFDPWIISGRDDLITRLLLVIGQRLAANPDKNIRAVGAEFLSYVKALGWAADVVAKAAGYTFPGLGKLISGAAGIAKKLLDDAPDLHEQRKRLQTALTKAQVAIIVMIDEIDRLDDGEIRSVAQFVRAIADFDRISYLLAYDQKRVAEALGGGTTDDHRARGAAYLEKIVQYQIPLPVAFPEELSRLARDLLGQFMPEGWTSTERWEELNRLLIPDIFRTPRDIKRFAGQAKVQIAMEMGNEVDPIDVLGWSALLSKAPRTVDAIRDKPYLVGLPAVSLDPDDPQHTLSPGLAPAIRDRLSLVGDEGDAVMALLGFLFPLATQSPSSGGRMPNSISNPRPFLTMLRQGLPPGQISRDTVRNFLTADTGERHDQLSRLSQDGNVERFLVRLSEAYTDAPDFDDVALWTDFASYLEIKSAQIPWPQDITPEHFLGETFFQRMTSGPNPWQDQYEGIDDIYYQLRTQMDWHIAPAMLDSQIWANGVLDCHGQEGGKTFLGKSKTLAQAQEMGGQMAAAVLADPEVIGRLRTPLPLIITMRGSAWTENCRWALTELVKEPAKANSVVLLLFGNNRMVDRELLDQLLEADVLRRTILKNGTREQNPALISASLRLARTWARR